MKHILIVDDRQDNLYYLDALLSAHGYRVDTARHGAEALAKALRTPPGLVVSDLLMPVMDGYTLLRLWKADARLADIPFVVYTATYTDPGDERLALRLGADAFILKPSEPEAFIASLLALLDLPKTQAPSPLSADEDRELLTVYNTTLVRKLERKSRELAEANLALTRELAERKKLEAQALRTQRMESIGTLAGGIAHDLNNLLTPILMAVDLLKAGECGEGSLKLLATVEASAQRGADLVKQVLGFARGMDGQRIEVDTLPILRELHAMLRETFPKSIAIHMGEGGGPWTVTGDPTQIQQVLLNLCVNARDAMPDGGTLRLSAERVEVDAGAAGSEIDAAPGPYLRFRVEDSGVGIPAENLERIFEPFFTTKELGKGTGLGLSTALAIVRSHGGFVRVDSASGRGTCFEVFFPAPASPPAACAAAGASARLCRGQGECVLLVDDEASIRKIARQTLEAFGYRVILAANGAEAVAAYTAQGAEIDVVLTDMSMPVMDGHATIQALRALRPDLKIIASSGLPDPGSASDGLNFTLAKPYSTEALLAVLSRALRPSAP